MSHSGSYNSLLPNREGAEFLWSLYEHAEVGVVQVGADGTLKWANAALCRMLGYNQNELLHKAFEDIVPAKNRPRQMTLLHRILTGKYSCHDVEEQFLHRTGTEVSATVTSLLVNGSGAGCYCMNIVRDTRPCAPEGLNFGLIVESAPNPMLLIGDGGDIILANSHCESLFGYQRGELTHQPISTLLPDRMQLGTTEPRDDYSVASNHQKLQRRRDLIGLHRNGSVLPVQLNLHSIPFRDHHWVLASLTDMTDHSRALQSLQESEERFRTIFNDAPAGMALTSTTGRFIFVNTALCEFVGYSRNELSAKDLISITYPKDKDETLQQLRQLASGRTARAKEEYRFVHKNGQTLWGDVRRSLIRDSQTGKPKYIVSHIIDITDRKHMEQRLRETEERFRTIADSAPVLIWMAGPEKARTYFNRGWLDFTGRALDEELGDGWIQRVHPHDVSTLIESYQHGFDQHVKFTLSYRVRRHDGEYRWLVDTGAPRFNPDGSFAGYIGSCIDETDRRAAE